jgi:hypothetical protein
VGCVHFYHSSVCQSMSGVGQTVKHTSMSKAITIKIYDDIKISNSRNMFGVRMGACVIIMCFTQ